MILNSIENFPITLPATELNIEDEQNDIRIYSSSYSQQQVSFNFLQAKFTATVAMK